MDHGTGDWISMNQRQSHLQLGKVFEFQLHKAFSGDIQMFAMKCITTVRLTLTKTYATTRRDLERKLCLQNSYFKLYVAVIDRMSELLETVF